MSERQVGPCVFCGFEWRTKMADDPVACARCKHYGWDGTKRSMKTGRAIITLVRSNVLQHEKPEIMRLFAQGQTVEQIGKILGLRTFAVQRVLNSTQAPILNNVKSELKPKIHQLHDDGLSNEQLAKMFSVTEDAVVRVLTAKPLSSRAEKEAHLRALCEAMPADIVALLHHAKKTHGAIMMAKSELYRRGGCDDKMIAYVMAHPDIVGAEVKKKFTRMAVKESK